MQRLNGYVLAGGQSSRMGTDKALLRLGERNLLEIALDKVRTVCGDAAILCGSPARAEKLQQYGRCLTDGPPDCGPLGGIAAALQDAREERVMIVPVDMPALPVSLLERLAVFEAACFSVDGFLQPLPVVLPRTFAAAADDAVRNGERKLMPWLQRIGVSFVPVTGDPLFANVNTPQEFEWARRCAESR